MLDDWLGFYYLPLHDVMFCKSSTFASVMRRVRAMVYDTLPKVF